jgi:putative tryptophan/tyrosine transport system substrate-binding protein
MRRREFITFLGGAVSLAAIKAGPIPARAQGERVRRVGWLTVGIENDPGGQAQRKALREGLAKLGWLEGRNLQIDLRLTTGDLALMRSHAAELVALAPDVMVASGGAPTRVLLEATKTIPIVFVSIGDPVAAGLVQNIARPESNATGFSNSEPSIAGKWLELLREAAPSIARVAVVSNPNLTSRPSIYLAAIEAAARSLRVQNINTPVRNAGETTRAIDTFAAQPRGGLLILPPSPTLRATIVELAARHRLPAIYPTHEDAAAGGLLAYAPDRVDEHRRAADYLDRLLRGAKVIELPVQFPTKFELVVNLKTAKAIGLAMPRAVLLRADELIE